MLLNLCNNISFVGGEGGIRTPGTRKRTIDFESTALDHSATSPRELRIVKNVLHRFEKILLSQICWSGIAIRAVSENSL